MSFLLVSLVNCLRQLLHVDPWAVRGVIFGGRNMTLKKCISWVSILNAGGYKLACNLEAL
jgi:hypothetical protein